MESNVVGVRELKTHLGAHLRRVRAGRAIVVTDRGVPIAELRPLGRSGGVEASLAELRAAGVVSGGTGQALAPFKPIKSRGGSFSAVVIADRGDRF